MGCRRGDELSRALSTAEPAGFPGKEIQHFMSSKEWQAARSRKRLLGRSEEMEPLPQTKQTFEDRKVGVGRCKSALSFGRGLQRAKGERRGTNTAAELEEGAARVCVPWRELHGGAAN